MLTEWGLTPAQIKIVSVLGSKSGVEHVTAEFPDVEVGWSLLQRANPQIYIGAIDDELTDKGYISPGLGDAGDRLFNTHNN